MRLFISFLAASALAGTVPLVSSPVVTHIVPGAPAVSDRAQMVAVHGKEFMRGLTFYVTSPEGATADYSGSAIQAQTDTSFQVSLVFGTAGKYQLVVTNKDGGTSDPFVVDVQPGQPRADAPVISGVAPPEPTKHPEPQLLRVAGQRFESGLRAILTDPIGTEMLEIEVGRVTPTSFDLRARLAQDGTYELVVRNASGAVSNVFQFTVR
jgi:hypothetical protein